MTTQVDGSAPQKKAPETNGAQGKPPEGAGPQKKPAPGGPGPQKKPAPGGPGPQQSRVPASPAEQKEKAREATEAARALRKTRGRRLALRFALAVVLPTVLATIYYGRVATDQYESVSLFTVQSAESAPSISLETIIGGVPTASVQDTLAVRDYILSRDMLARLDKEHELIAHYRDPSVDWLSRFTENSFEDAYEYYLDKVLLHFDSASGVLTLTVRAFAAERAEVFARAILGYSEERVNQLSERARQDQMQFALNEVKKAEKRLTKARQSVLEWQRERGEFNPEQTASAAMQIRTGLETERAKARAELMQLRSYMRPDAPKVVAARERVKSLSAQAAGESHRLVNPKSDKSLNEKIAQFEGAILEKEFSEKAYESALTSLEVARTEVARQHRYLATVADPSRADESMYPNRWLGVLTVFIASFLLLGIGSLGVAAVKEHARI